MFCFVNGENFLEKRLRSLLIHLLPKVNDLVAKKALGKLGGNREGVVARRSEAGEIPQKFKHGAPWINKIHIVAVLELPL